MWRRAQALLCAGLMLALAGPVLQAGSSSEEGPSANTCITTDDVVRIPAGTHNPWHLHFTGNAHGTYLAQVPLFHDPADFFLVKTDSSTVTVLSRTFPDFDLLIELQGGGTRLFNEDGDETGSWSGVESLYVFMPYGPDPLVVGDGAPGGAAFALVQCAK